MPTLARIALCALALPVFPLLACGGKILEEPGAGPTGGVAAEPPRQEPAPLLPSGPALDEATVADACAAICDRDGRCGAWQWGCNASCESEIVASSACAPQASAYVHCYADNLQPSGCSMVPPICEQAYCAYARCTGKGRPAYCP
jgi:hypothetical protein